MSITHIGAASIWVNDMDRAVDYYTRVLELTLEKRVDEQNHAPMAWLRFPEGRAIVILADAKSMRAEGRVGGFTGLVLDVDDAERTYRELESRGATFVGPLMKGPDALRLMVADPDGNHVLLYQPLDEADRH